MITLVGYENVTPLHEGNELSLCRAIRKYDDFPVLIKYPNSDLPSPRILSGLKNEYAASQEIDNSSVIQAITLHRTDNSLALILEDKDYLLLKELKNSKEVDLIKKIKIAVRIAKSMSLIHSKGFLHRNIRPDSIALTGDFTEVAFTNLQYSSRISDTYSSTNTGLISDENITYISPEQSGRINGELDRRSDFYSLGVTLFEFFTGRPPFVARDALELIHNHLAKEPPIPHEINKDVPESISAVILKLLAKNPGDRYQSTHGIIQDLKSCLRIIKKHESQEAFYVGSQDISDTFTLSRRLFGRKTEKGILLESYHKTSLGSCEVVMVRGEPGCGKTTLVKSISKRVFEDRGEFISGKFDQYRRNRPYSAVIQAFQEMLRKRLDSSAPVIEAWKRRILNALGSNAGLITEVIPELEQLIGHQTLPSILPSAESRNRFNLTFINFIKVFPSMDKPLVLFLDDLQWADSSTISLIKRLLEDEEISYLMLIGAYRTSHPLDENILTMLTELEELSTNVETLTLDRLKLRHVHGFVSRTLRSERKRTEELTRLIYNRTGGNPLFVREYLRNLYRGGLIEFNSSKTRWEWDLKAIRDISMEGNIVELMADKIMGQPLEGREIIKAASCIGGKFDLRILVAVSDTTEDLVVDFMNLALQEGLIVSEDDIPKAVISLDTEINSPQFLSFMHDRVQQAAYSMLDAAEKNMLHLRIGRAMLEILSESEIDEMVFEIAAQFRSCSSELSDPVEKDKVSEIFLRSGRKAKRSSAFELAAKYISAAARLMREDCWQTDYQKTYDLYLDWFECNYLSGSAKNGEGVFKELLSHVTDRSDIVRANITKIQLYFDQSRYHDAVKIGIEMLELYKVGIPIQPAKITMVVELLKTRIALRGKKAEQLFNQPEMSSSDHQEIMRILMYTIAPAYMFNKKLVFLMILKMIRITLKYGNAPSSAYGYMFYAMFLAAKDFSFDKSKQFTKLAVDLNKHFKNSELETKINMLRGGMHDHWHVSLFQNISTLEKAYQSGLLYGDNAYARYSAYFIVYYKFLQGNSLSDVHSSAEKFTNFIRKNKNSLSTGNLNLAIQMCKSLEGKTYTPGYLDDEYFREAKLVSMSKSSGSEVIEHWTGMSKIITLTIFGYHQKALDCIELIYDDIGDTLFGMYIVPVFHFFSIVNMSAVYADSSGAEQRKYLKNIKRSLKKLERWQLNCPENFRHLYLIAKAEFSKLTGKFNEGIFLYEEAIRSSVKVGSNCFAALACEFAAKFHFTIGGKRSGLTLLGEACQFYRRWGAAAKVKRLMREHRLLQSEALPPFVEMDKNEQSGSSKTNYSLDISAVVKASQAISGEIVLDRLLDKLMRIVIENAGAQKATLLLNNKNTLELTAHAFVSEHGIITRVKPSPDQDLYCNSIVNYVLRSKDNIVLRDAGAQGPFSIDSYIIRTKPKSILAMPVVNQQIMRGVLYLENNLSPGVFTEDRLEVLNLLCSQAAISIQNARLYSDLRDSETQHRTLLENINVGAFRASADADGRLIKGNRALAEMFGYRSWNEFKNIPVRSLFLDPKMHQTLLDQLIKGNPVRDREVNMRRLDGTPIWINMTASLRRDSSERDNCIEGVFEDITERRKAQELERAKVAADAANKAKSDFLASMSHEIRTPMNAILGMADMLWESKLSKVQRNYVKLFRNAGENLLLLINDILDLSKIEAGQITLEEIDFNLEDLFEEIGSIFALRAQAKSISFCWHISSDLPRIITGDPTRIRQVIVNLVGNALKFTESGTITFEGALTEGGLLRVLIRDTGVGIPVEKMNSVFDTFSQADSSTTRNFGGTGLGLSICTSMVSSMNGGLFVSSEEGIGSSFGFTIKISIPMQPELPLPLVDTHILLVEKATVCRDYLAQSLIDLGANVYVAEEINEASSKAAEISFVSSCDNVLIVGIPVGENDRFEILKKLKKELCRDWKLIMIVAAKPKPRATVRAKRLGASYVHRPVHPLAIAEEIKYASTSFTEQIEPTEVICKDDPLKKAANDEASILLVEDSEDNRMVIDLYLKKTPYNVDYAVNGQDGLNKYIAGKYDLILMDIQMPVMDGYEATMAIRNYEDEKKMSQVPILALTANAFQDDEQKCIECGCTAHLAKPVKKKKLLKTIEEYLGVK